MPLLGEFSALVTAFLWSGSAIVFGAATARMGSVFVNISRLVLAAMYLLALVAVLQLSLRLSPSQYLNLSISGFIGLTLGDTFLFKAFQQIGSRLSMLVMALSPAVAAVLAYWFLGEGLTLLGVAGIIVTIVGIAIVVLERRDPAASRYHITASGLVYGVLGAVGQGAGLIFAKLAFAEGPINGFVATVVRILASLLILLPAALVTGRFKNPIHRMVADRKAFLLLLAGSILGPFLGISMSLIAVSHTDVGVAATIMAMVPILMLPLVKYVYKEKLSWKAIAGAFIAVGGIAILFLR